MSVNRSASKDELSALAVGFSTRSYTNAGDLFDTLLNDDFAASLFSCADDVAPDELPSRIAADLLAEHIFELDYDSTNAICVDILAAELHWCRQRYSSAISAPSAKSSAESASGRESVAVVPLALIALSTGLRAVKAISGKVCVRKC